MYDIIIIGSGTAGLSAAVYAARAGLDFAVIEKEYMGTGQIAYTERVDNYLGFYGIDGFSLGEKFREHALEAGTEFIEGEVTGVTTSDGVWKAELSDGRAIEAGAVIYAAGASPKKLDIPGENEFAGRGVSYCAVCDGAFFSEKTVAVIGGGDTALSDALYLSGLAEKVYIIHRRDSFRANSSLVKKVSECGNTEFIYNAIPIEVMGGEAVTGVRYLQDGEEKLISADGVFAAVGTVPQTALLKGITELDENGYIIANENCVSYAAGLFAAGDVRTKQLRQLITAAADGANAVMSAESYLRNK